ncbi:helix-turn-helix domain-containing protein [Streptomyces racemochromogenes]|uniref:helix-turn-helix domain-containing protein n=1 Tax=Streptomyces racemochromogenes TaxID=67353 RepID=UPI0031EE306B
MTQSLATPAGNSAAADLVLGSHLAAQRKRAGVGLGEAAKRIRVLPSTVTQYETGAAPIPENELCSLMSLYGQTPEAIRDARQLLHQAKPDEFRDYGGWARNRLRALEARAQRITAFPCWDEPAVMAAQLLYWTGLALTRGIELGVLPHDHGITSRTGVLIEVTMAGTADRVWVDDVTSPVYSTGQPGSSRSALLRQVEAHVLSPRDSLQAVREAADRWADSGVAALPRTHTFGRRREPDPAVP